MLQVQQQLVQSLQSSEVEILPEQFAAWAVHPVTKHFLRIFQAAAIGKQSYIETPNLERSVCRNFGYMLAIEDMEEIIEEYRQQTEAEGGEDE